MTLHEFAKIFLTVFFGSNQNYRKLIEHFNTIVIEGYYIIFDFDKDHCIEIKELINYFSSNKLI